MFLICVITGVFIAVLATRLSAHVTGHGAINEAPEFIEDPISGFILAELPGIDKGLVLTDIYDNFVMRVQLGLYKRANELER